MTRSTANSVACAPRWRLMNWVADSAVISPRRGAAMRLSRVSLAAVVALAGMLSANPAPARALPFNAVTEWNLIAVNTLVALPGPAGGAPPSAQIHVGMVQGAVYDAVNATEPKHYRPYLLSRRFSARASQEAAVATAAYGVLKSIVSTVPNISADARAAVLASLLGQYNASLAAIPDSPFKRQGIRAGNAAADAMIAARQNDGRFGPSQWVPNSSVGHWQPLPGTADPTPWVGLVKPFLMESSSQFRTAGPLALNSPAYAAEFNEVKAIGATNSATRTTTQTYVARWWQSTPNGLWNAVARDLVERNSFDLLDSARLFAMQNLSAADAAINCWNDKYFYDFWRPVNAIRSTLDDGNSATEADPAWTPLINAPYPDHPSGHLCLDGAHTGVLAMFFGDVIAGGYQITTASTLILPGDPVTRSFDSFSQALTELIEARIWAGLHFRTADIQGRSLGMNIADFAADNYFQPVGRGRR